MADGSTDHTLLCLGNIKLNQEEQPGLIVISKGSDILLGMEFLRKFKKKLIVDYENRVMRLD